MYTPVNSSFTIQKWGLRESKLYRYVFVMTSFRRVLEDVMIIYGRYTDFEHSEMKRLVSCVILNTCAINKFEVTVGALFIYLFIFYLFYFILFIFYFLLFIFFFYSFFLFIYLFIFFIFFCCFFFFFFFFSQLRRIDKLIEGNSF